LLPIELQQPAASEKFGEHTQLVSVVAPELTAAIVAAVPALDMPTRTSR
jgi:hypothetical protein